MQGTIGCEQADRASAENGHAIPFGDLSKFGRMVACGKGISQQHKIMFPLVTRFSWQAQAVGIGKRDTHQLRLGSPIRSHAGIAIRRSDRSRVGGQARGAIAAHAVVAKATADVRRHHHPVTFAYGDNGRADRFDDPQGFVPDDHAIDFTHAPFVDVQISSADGSGGEAHEHIGRCFETSILHRLNIQCPITSPDNGFHSVSFFL